jgi:hypothetical protein
MSDYLSRPETSGSDRAENSTKFPAITKRDAQHTVKLFEGSESLIGESTEEMIHHAPYSQTICSANSEHMQILRKGFEISKSRMSELSKTPAGHLHLQLHGANANRVYNALSTLLYGSISVYKADELERYIRKKSKTLPSSVFNIDDWDQILSIARDARMGDLAILKQDIDAQKQVRCRSSRRDALYFRPPCSSTFLLFLLLGYFSPKLDDDQRSHCCESTSFIAQRWR